MGKKYRSVWYRCLATLLMAVMLLGNLGYMPEAKAAIEVQKADFLAKANTVISQNQKYGYTGAFCLGWVDKFWNREFGNKLSSTCCADKYSRGSGRIVSTSKTNIPIGANVYFRGGSTLVCDTCGRNCGHVGIYVGNGKVLSLCNVGGKFGAQSFSISQWESWGKANGYYKYAGWGWHDGVRVVDNYTTIDSTLRIGISTKPASGEDQCYVKEKPFEDSNNKSASVPEGNAVRIVGAVENKYGNTWYKTADGGFVWEGDVTVWEYSTLFSASANFQTVKKQNSHAAPYVDSGTVNTYPAGTVFEVKAFVTNSYGNVWVELANGSYINFYDKNSDKLNHVEFISHVTEPTISNATQPTGNRNAGSSFAMKGIIKAQVPFISVSCRIIDRQTGTDAAGPGTPITVKPGVGTRSVDISKTVNGVNLDTSTKFGKLTKGWYRYEINAQFGFTYNGKTFNFGSEQNFVSSEFTVGNPGTLTEEAPPAGDEEPPAGDVSGRIPGDVNENGSFEPLDALRMLKWLAGWDVTINESNADVNGNGSADPLDGLRMLKALAGWDVVLQ